MANFIVRAGGGGATGYNSQDILVEGVIDSNTARKVVESRYPGIRIYGVRREG